ncbi:hypothetical protein ACE6H2_016361 [Prunus campanulata]
MVGGVIWWVLSEIQSLELRNTPTTPIRNELPLNQVVQFLTPIDFRWSPQLGHHHNMVGGVIWCVLSEIQSLEQRNAPTTSIRNELRSDLNCPISYPIDFRSSPKLGHHRNMVAGVIW